MDRFIDYKAVQNSIHRGNLKSNMDRFIDKTINEIRQQTACI